MKKISQNEKKNLMSRMKNCKTCRYFFVLQFVNYKCKKLKFRKKNIKLTKTYVLSKAVFDFSKFWI